MFNLLLWVLLQQAKLTNKLINLVSGKDKKDNVDLVGNRQEIKYFCWCISDRNEVVGNPIIISASDPQAAALEYYVNYIPQPVKVSFMESGHTLTSISRPVK